MFAVILGIVAVVRIVINAARDPAVRGLVITLVAILTIGTLSYHSIEGWSFVDSFYFSVVALLTVGFGDLVPTTDFGKLFTCGYLLVGVGFIAAAATTIVQRSRLWLRIEDRVEAADSERGINRSS